MRAFFAALAMGIIGSVIRERLPLHSVTGTCLYATEMTLCWIAVYHAAVAFYHATVLGILDKAPLRIAACSLLLAALRTHMIIRFFLWIWTPSTGGTSPLPCGTPVRSQSLHFPHVSPREEISMAPNQSHQRFFEFCGLGRCLGGFLTAACCLAGSAWAEETPDQTPPKASNAEGEKPAATLKPLSQQQQDELLQTRLKGSPFSRGPWAGVPWEGGAVKTFGQFANVFLVMSRVQLPYGVGLMAASREVSQAEFHPVFPEFYEPTLRELLDAIALQTSSEWKYDPSSKHFHSEVEKGPVDGIAIFEFTAAKRPKPYQVSVPKGWKTVDHGNWMMYVPPQFPVGMDIHELGTYSADDKTKEKELLQRVRLEVSLMWANQAQDQVQQQDLKPVKLGPYDALYFETLMPLRTGDKMRWRQWTFMVDNRCFFVISTILPRLEDQIFPEVEAMVQSFQIKKP